MGLGKSPSPAATSLRTSPGQRSPEPENNSSSCLGLRVYGLGLRANNDVLPFSSTVPASSYTLHPEHYNP